MQPRSERRIPINNSTEVRLSVSDTGRLLISSVSDTDTIVVATGSITVSAVNDFYNGLRFRKEEALPAGAYSLAQRRSGGHYLVTDYNGTTKALDFTPANAAQADFAAGMSIILGPSLPAAFAELNIGGGSSAFRISERSGGTAGTDYMKIGAGLFRTYVGTEGGRSTITDLYILSENAGGDTITVEYK